MKPHPILRGANEQVPGGPEHPNDEAADRPPIPLPPGVKRPRHAPRAHHSVPPSPSEPLAMREGSVVRLELPQGRRLVRPLWLSLDKRCTTVAATQHTRHVLGSALRAPHPTISPPPGLLGTGGPMLDEVDRVGGTGHPSGWPRWGGSDHAALGVSRTRRRARRRPPRTSGRRGR